MRRAPRFVVPVVAVLAIVELGGLVVGWVGERELVLWPGWQARRAAVIERFDPDREPATESVSGLTEAPDVIHPYLGFVADASRAGGINEYGFPGSGSPLVQRSPDRVIVALLGGSAAIELATRGREELERVIGGQPAYEGREVVVVCLAHRDYKQPQQLLALSYMLALGAEFDLVVNIDGFNEVALHEAGNALKRVFPVYPANWYLYTSSVPDPSLRRLIGRRAYLEEEMVARARRYSRAPWRFSLALNAWWGRLQARAAETHAALGDEIRGYATRDEEKLPYWVQGPPIAFEDDDRLHDLLVGVWRHGSLQLAGLCRENGIRYLHLLQPGVSRGYPRLVEAGKELAERDVRFVDLAGEEVAGGDALARHIGRVLAAG